jgi:hypothetical protein
MCSPPGSTSRKWLVGLDLKRRMTAMKIESRRDVVLCLADMLTTMGNDAAEGVDVNWESEAEQIIEFVIENVPILSHTGEKV